MSQPDAGAAQDQQNLLRHSARDFVENAFPLGRLLEIERTGSGGADVWASLVQMGWSGILLPEEHGGSETALGDAFVLYEEMGRGLIPTLHHSTTILAGGMINAGGPEKLKYDLLPAIIDGTKVIVPAIPDAEGAWIPESVQLRAEKDGAGYVLNGRKQFVPDVDAADAVLCAARTGPGTHDITLFVVDLQSAGVETRHMSGWTGSPLFEISFKDVDVREDRVVGGINDGWKIAERAAQVGTILLCAYMAGAAMRVYEMSIDYAHTRVQFGQAIARFQRVQDHIVDIRNHVDAARLSAVEALDHLVRDAADVDLYVSLAKALASDGFWYTCEAAHHVHAGIGATKDYGLYLYTKASHSLYHYLGAPGFHRDRIGDLIASGAS